MLPLPPLNVGQNAAIETAHVIGSENNERKKVYNENKIALQQVQ